MTCAERGFVLLVGAGGKLEAQVASGFPPGPLGESFEGSLGAIEHVLQSGESVVVSDAGADPLLGQRPSVVGSKIGTLACVPLVSGERVIGLIYVDGRKREGAFSDLDLEILEALAANVSVVLSTVSIDREIRELLGREGSSTEDRGFLDALDRRVSEIVRGTSSPDRSARGALGSP